MPTESRRYAGFTLIEFSLVVSIIGLLLAIAVPVFQNYSIRAKNAECLHIASSAKLFVYDMAMSQGIPIDSGNLQFPGWPGPISTEYCSSVTIADGTGVITVTTNVPGSSGTFTLTPTQASISDAIQWDCTSNVPSQYAPKPCRGS